MKLCGYYIKRTKEVNPNDWPPIARPKFVEDADQVELFDYPGDHKDRVFLYVVWSDKTKYIAPWDLLMLGRCIPDKFKGVLKKKRKIWSEKLEKNLLKDARPNEYVK